MPEQRNLIFAVVFSLAILLGFELLFSPQIFGTKQPTETAETADGANTLPNAPAEADTLPRPAGAPGGMDGLTPAQSRAQALAGVDRVRIETPRLNGSIALTGARIDDLRLVDYHRTPDEASPQIELFSPKGSPHPYYAQFGWVPSVEGMAVPGDDTEWTTDADVLAPGSPVTLSWNNGAGLTFLRTIAVDDNYMFTVTQRVENASGQAVTLFPYGLVSRWTTPDTLGFYILHEGPLGVLNDSLVEYDYDDLEDEGSIRADTTGGWLGITDKYWLAALVPDQAAPVTTRFNHTRTTNVMGNVDRYQTDYLGPAAQAADGGALEVTNRLFAGAKEVSLLDGYTEELGVKRFDLAVDFGWFYFMTKPFFHALHFLAGVFGNFGVAILAFTVAIKLVLFPLANKSYRSMSKMKKLQPEMKKLQERFKDDKQRMQQELMALYKREKANPVSGCLPILVQIPVFFALYKVLFVTIEMRHAPFFGWIKDLSAPDPTSIFNAFGLIPWTPPDLMMIGVWPLIMGFTMWLQMRLNPTPPDPIQQKIMAFLPLVFTVMLAQFPAGLVIYWAWNNGLSILQQWVIMRQMGVKAG